MYIRKKYIYYNETSRRAQKRMSIGIKSVQRQFASVLSEIMSMYVWNLAGIGVVRGVVHTWHNGLPRCHRVELENNVFLECTAKLQSVLNNNTFICFTLTVFLM